MEEKQLAEIEARLAETHYPEHGAMIPASICAAAVRALIAEVRRLREFEDERRCVYLTPEERRVVQKQANAAA